MISLVDASWRGKRPRGCLLAGETTSRMPLGGGNDLADGFTPPSMTQECLRESAYPPPLEPEDPEQTRPETISRHQDGLVTPPRPSRSRKRHLSEGRPRQAARDGMAPRRGIRLRPGVTPRRGSRPVGGHAPAGYRARAFRRGKCHGGCLAAGKRPCGGIHASLRDAGTPPRDGVSPATSPQRADLRLRRAL
jgi:hypothetical protein